MRTDNINSGPTRIRTLTSDTPLRLLVDDDELRHMPDMNGIEFTEDLRQAGCLTTYIIMLTVCDSVDDYEGGYHAGVNDYLSKRAPATELLARIHAAFESLRLRHAVRGSGDALTSKVAL